MPEAPLQEFADDGSEGLGILEQPGVTCTLDHDEVAAGAAGGVPGAGQGHDPVPLTVENEDRHSRLPYPVEDVPAGR
jgi:hypothetical protein